MPTNSSDPATKHTTRAIGPNGRTIHFDDLVSDGEIVEVGGRRMRVYYDPQAPDWFVEDERSASDAAKVVLDVLERLWQGKYVARGTYLEAKSLLDPDGSQEGLETNRLDAASSPERPAASSEAMVEFYVEPFKDELSDVGSASVAHE